MAAGVLMRDDLHRRLRRSALLWGLIAAAFYVGFIILSVLRGVK